MAHMGRDCAVHVHEDEVPIEQHHIWPLGMGGPKTAENTVSVCSNGHAAIHDYMRLLARGKVSWEEERRYGPKVRRLAQRGLENAVAASN